MLYLATNDGVALCQRTDEGWQVAGRSLDDHHVSSIIAREGVVLAGTKDGVFRSEDGGETWHEASRGLHLRHVRWLAYRPDVSDFEVAGTEPAAIFISRDGAGTWQERPEVGALRDEYGWYLPYSPRAGCIRGFAFHGERGYAAAEDGALLRSDDGGVSWRLAPGSAGPPQHNPGPGQIHSDVHSVAVHSTAADLVVAPTGGGLFRSQDGGQTWENLYRCYCRAVWLDPEDPQHLIFGPADGVDRRGRIEETRDGGEMWQPRYEGAGAPWPRHMVERFVAAGDELLAVLSNGQLLAAPLAALAWQAVAADAGWVNDVATMA